VAFSRTTAAKFAKKFQSTSRNPQDAQLFCSARTIMARGTYHGSNIWQKIHAVALLLSRWRSDPQVAQMF